MKEKPTFGELNNASATKLCSLTLCEKLLELKNTNREKALIKHILMHVSFLFV